MQATGAVGQALEEGTLFSRGLTLHTRALTLGWSQGNTPFSVIFLL